MIDLSRTRFIITCWPDHRWPVEVMWFIEQLMKDVPHREDYRDSLKVLDRTCARNRAVRDSALGSDRTYQHFVFIDRDVRPKKSTARFLDLDADIKCCQVPMHNPEAWSCPDSFHEAIWCTSRKVLESIKPPWFMPAYNEDGTEREGCTCLSFRKKALAAGFTIAHGGWAEHDRDGSWCG